MVYGAIVEKGEPWYTNMGKVFAAIHNRQLEYNWLITDVELVAEKVEEDYCENHKYYCWLTGEELTEIVRSDDRQWVWAVLSGFEKEILLEEVLQYPKPYANGYPLFWENPLLIQHPLATIEIVPWDGTKTLLYSRKKKLVDDFRAYFPQSEDLYALNASFIEQIGNQD